MKVQVLSVFWHEREPVYSIDCHSSGRVATAGADKEAKLWRISTSLSNFGIVTFLCSLVRHSGSVNVVRFAPKGDILASGADDGFVFIWQLSSVKEETTKEPKTEEQEPKNVEEWTVVKSIKAPAADVCDISWSQDCKFIVGASAENTAFVGSVRTGQVLCVLKDHFHFVQGVAFDPRNVYVVTQSSDQTCRIYKRKQAGSGKLQIYRVIKELRPPKQPPPPQQQKDKKDSQSATSENEKEIDESDLMIDENEEKKPIIDQQKQNQIQIHNQNQNQNQPPLKRLHKEADQLEENQQQVCRPRLFLGESATTFFRRPGWSPDGSFIALPTGVVSSANQQLTNTAWVFSRKNFSRPAFHVPGHKKTVVSVKWCPILFQSSSKQQQQSSPGYKMVFAVATLDSVSLYDTETFQTIGVANGLHFAAITDLCWSTDGSYLLTSSSDNFCSLIAFEKEELGIPLLNEQFPPVMNEIMKIREGITTNQTTENEETPDTILQSTPPLSQTTTKPINTTNNNNNTAPTNTIVLQQNQNQQQQQQTPQRKRIQPTLLSFITQKQAPQESHNDQKSKPTQ